MGESLEISERKSERTVDFLCVKSQSNKKNLSKQKTARALRTNNSSLSELFHAILRDLHSLTGNTQYHISKTKNGLTCVYI